jgi:hypothetical protein
MNTKLPDINQMSAFDAKQWLSIVNNYSPVGLSKRILCSKRDRFWKMYWTTNENMWLNLISVIERELQRRQHKH